MRPGQGCSVVDVGKLMRVILVCAAASALSGAAAAAGQNEAAAREIQQYVNSASSPGSVD